MKKVRVGFFDTHDFEKEYFERENSKLENRFEFSFFKERLNTQSVALTQGCDAVCSFVNDRLDAPAIQGLKENGVRLIALRSAGFNHVDRVAAQSAQIPVVRVPAYSPHAVAEHAVAMLMTLNRKTHKAYMRVREGSFLLDGLVGFDLFEKTVGVIGTGKIGTVFAKIMLGFGCKVLAFDPKINADLVQLGVQYAPLNQVLEQSQVLSLHVPLTPDTYHLINEQSLALTLPGVILINTGRGGLVDVKALIRSLKTGHIGAAGLDVYEEEENLFFTDHSGDVIQDDTFVRLLTFPNVLITSHQAFLTIEALREISRVTLQNISSYFIQGTVENSVG